jgi:hypothetical protein
MSKRTKIPVEVQKYLAELGRKGGKIGGKSTSEAKCEAGRRNLAAARAARRRQEVNDAD